MTVQQATAEIFLTAFKALPRMEKNTFLFKLVKDKSIREDLIDLAIAEARMKEKAIPFKTFLKSLEKSSKQ